jgi:hypothetical protein
MRKIKAALLLAGLLAAAAAARACLNGTPWELFMDRRATLRTVPSNSFAWEVLHLAKADGLARPSGRVTDRTEQQIRDDAEQLSAPQLAVLAAMRAAPDGRAAFAIHGDLPPGVRLYTAGAVDFLHGNMSGAAGFFSGVLALPAANSAARAVWAQFMLGRVAAKAGNARQAEAAFVQTRALAAQGKPDPHALALESLGAQAKLHLDSGDVAGAVALYAQQAADGSDDAVQSLRIVAEHAMSHLQQLPNLVTDPLTQRLLVVHALAQAGDYLHRLHAGGTEFESAYNGFFPPEELDHAPLRALVDAIVAAKVAVPQADRLAALAYEVGEFARADQLASTGTGPMAYWVRAKIALLRGDHSQGAQFYARALDADATAVLEPDSVTLLRGENGTIALTQGDFQQAIAVLWPVASTYWGDVAYLAERVLTTDALKDFVDTHAPKASDPGAGARDSAAMLRALLARRLMRDHRDNEALAYFDPPQKDQPDIRQAARAFIAAQRRAHAAFWSSDRARAGWQAAILLRTQGMELTGTELNPDQTALGGAFDGGYGPDDKGPNWEIGTFVPAEQTRFAASAPVPNLRFHYRYLAADIALRAAQDVPARSQAYAAMLCRATEWMLDSHDNARASGIYAIYVQHGAMVPFAIHFGHHCPDPDFSTLNATRRKLLVSDGRTLLHRWKYPAGFGGAAMMGAIATAAFIRRSKPTKPGV